MIWYLYFIRAYILRGRATVLFEKWKSVDVVSMRAIEDVIMDEKKVLGESKDSHCL